MSPLFSLSLDGSACNAPFMHAQDYVIPAVPSLSSVVYIPTSLLFL